VIDVLPADGKCGRGEVHIAGDDLANVGYGVLPDQKLQLDRESVEREGRHCLVGGGLIEVGGDAVSVQSH
jgi:hypothetical protein